MRGAVAGGTHLGPDYQPYRKLGTDYLARTSSTKEHQGNGMELQQTRS